MIICNCFINLTADMTSKGQGKVCICILRVKLNAFFVKSNGVFIILHFSKSKNYNKIIYNFTCGRDLIELYGRSNHSCIFLLHGCNNPLPLGKVFICNR